MYERLHVRKSRMSLNFRFNLSNLYLASILFTWLKFRLQYLSVRRPGQRFHFLQCRGSSPSLPFVNRYGGTLRRAGWVAFTETFSRGKWLISHLPATFAIIIHIPCPLCPCIWRPCVPVPHVPASLTWCPQVPRLASPRPKSPHTRPDVPVPLSPSHFYTQPALQWQNISKALKNV